MPVNVYLFAIVVLIPLVNKPYKNEIVLLFDR